MRAGWIALTRKPTEGSARCNCGNPVGIGPITGTSRSASTPSSVPTIKATSGPGMNLVHLRGHSTPTRSVARAMAKALMLASAKADGSARSVPSGPPSAVGAPRNGRIWISITMTPMPDMNPDTTTCGV